MSFALSSVLCQTSTAGTHSRNFSHSSLPHDDETESSLSPSNSAVGVTCIPFCLPILTADLALSLRLIRPTGVLQPRLARVAPVGLDLPAFMLLLDLERISQFSKHL